MINRFTVTDYRNPNVNFIDGEDFWTSFKQKTNNTPSVTTQQAHTLSKLTASNLETNIKGKNFIVGTFNSETNEFSVSKNPVIHFSQESADAEAIRLAKLDHTKTYIAMQLKKGFKTVVTETTSTIH